MEKGNYQYLPTAFIIYKIGRYFYLLHPLGVVVINARGATIRWKAYYFKGNYASIGLGRM